MKFIYPYLRGFWSSSRYPWQFDFKVTQGLPPVDKPLWHKAYKILLDVSFFLEGGWLTIGKAFPTDRTHAKIFCARDVDSISCPRQMRCLQFWDEILGREENLIGFTNGFGRNLLWENWHMQWQFDGWLCLLYGVFSIPWKQALND